MKTASKIKTGTVKIIPAKEGHEDKGIDFDNSPFVMKKMERAREMISKCGFPPGTVPPKK
jgi:hypothetical protein